MRILLINHYAGGPDLGMEHRPYHLSREWISQGHEVLIVAAGFAHTRTHQPVDSGARCFQDLHGVPYLFLRTPSYKGNHIRRIVNILVFVWRLWGSAGFIARRFRPDVVIASSTYPPDIWPARRIALKAGARLVYEVHDLWPLSPIELGGFSPRHPYIRLLQKAENYAYKHADKVVSLLPHTLGHMTAHGMNPAKFIYVPNGVVADEWDVSVGIPAEHEEIIRNARDAGKLVVGYTGAHGIANALDPFIEAAALVKDLPVAFLLVGSGPEKERLVKKAQDAGVDAMFFAPSVAKRQLPALLHRMDILYVGFRKQSLYRFGVSPNKLFDYMMAGKPVIQAIRAGNDPVGEAGCGLSIGPDDPEAVAAAIRKLLAMTPEERREMGRAGKAYVTLHHDYRVLAARFAEGVSSLPDRHAAETQGHDDGNKEQRT